MRYNILDLIEEFDELGAFTFVKDAFFKILSLLPLFLCLLGVCMDIRRLNAKTAMTMVIDDAIPDSRSK